MAKIILCVLLCLSSFARAEEDAKKENEAEGSHFHLLDSKCEPEGADTFEIAPQSPPLDVDDPGTPGCNRWEINILVSGDWTNSVNHFEIPLFDINYGIGNNIQLKYEFPISETKGDETTDPGIGNSHFGIKYRFYDEEATGLELAVYPQIEFASPGEKSEGPDDDNDQESIVTLPVLMTRKVGTNSVGDILMTANLGYNYSYRKDVKNSGYFAIGLGVPVIKNLAIMGEITAARAVENNLEDIRDQLVKANLGFIATITNRFMVYASVGQSLYSSDQLQHTYGVAGIRILTPAMN